MFAGEWEQVDPPRTPENRRGKAPRIGYPIRCSERYAIWGKRSPPAESTYPCFLLWGRSLKI